MSSHHFVKEGQEPVLILDSIHESSEMIVLELLEWSPKVISGFLALEFAERYGFKVDTVYLPNDKKDAAEAFLAFQQPVETKFLMNDSSNNWLLEAIEGLWNTHNHEMTIVTDFKQAGPMEKLVQRLPSLNISLICNGMKGIRAKNGMYSKWLVTGSKLQIHGGKVIDLSPNLSQNDPGQVTVIKEGWANLTFDRDAWVLEGHL